MENAILQVNRLRKRSYRDQTGLVIVEGYPEVKKAIQKRIPMDVVYVCREIFQPDPEEFKDCPVVDVDRDTFAQMAFGERLKGVLALCRPERLDSEDLLLGKNPLIVILSGVEKPGNIGTVLRSADGAGVDLVIISSARTDVYNHNVVRSSIGAVFTVPVIEMTDEETLEFLKDNNIPLYAATAKGDCEYTQCDWVQATAIAVGNEHEGLSKPWLEQAQAAVKIPLTGASSSLNAAMSASILMFEAIRQRRS